MKIVDMAEATATLADYARDVGVDPVIVTVGGEPVAVLIAIENADLETVSLGTDAELMAIIERSRARHEAEGGISSDDMRRRLATER